MARNLFKWLLILVAVTMVVVPAYTLFKTFGHGIGNEKNESHLTDATLANSETASEKPNPIVRQKLNDTIDGFKKKAKNPPVLSGVY